MLGTGISAEQRHKQANTTTPALAAVLQLLCSPSLACPPAHLLPTCSHPPLPSRPWPLLVSAQDISTELLSTAAL